MRFCLLLVLLLVSGSGGGTAVVKAMLAATRDAGTTVEDLLSCVKHRLTLGEPTLSLYGRSGLRRIPSRLAQSHSSGNGLRIPRWRFLAPQSVFSFSLYLS
jgi:hypothetical protein